MPSESAQSLSLEASGQDVEPEILAAHNLETSSEDEFTDAREAITSPTRPNLQFERRERHAVDVEMPGPEIHRNSEKDPLPDQVVAQDITNSEDISLTSTVNVESPSDQILRTTVTQSPIDSTHGQALGMMASSLHSTDADPHAAVSWDEDVLSTRKDRQLNIEESTQRVRSPIAADGGFGPMETSEDPDQHVELDSGEESPPEEREQRNPQTVQDDEAGDDFDDFADGDDDDFGDFGDEFDEEPSMHPKNLEDIQFNFSFPILDGQSSKTSLDGLNELVAPHVNVLYPNAQEAYLSSITSSSPQTNSAFLSERSRSLWEQLIAPSPLQPPNWVRSRIRRLFLVSLGVPVDLDEILPKSQQKKLVLPYDPADGDKTSSKSKEAKAGTSTGSKEQHPGRSRGPPPPPEFDVEEVQRLCRKTEADLEEMSDSELQAHIVRLEQMSEMGKAVLMYWIERKKFAVDEKEAFDSVVESLVRHARRVRK